MNTARKNNKISAFFKNFWKYRFLLREIVRKNIKLQYRNSVLGIFWTFLQPLLTTLVLVLVFGGIFGKSNDGVVCYPIYLLCGRLIYEFYTQSTKRAMRSIRNSASVIKKVYVPKYMYPLANVVSNFSTFLISMSVLAVMILYYVLFTDVELHITAYMLLAPVPLIILLVLSTGVGLILAALNVFFKDVEYLYEVFCMLIFYATPIFYTVDALGASPLVATVLKINPLYSVVSMFRSCVLYGEMWDLGTCLYACCFSLAMLGIGSLVFYKKQDKFILHI